MLHIHIRQGGSLGNHMYQYMLAKTIEHDVIGDVEISGYDMEAWNLHSTHKKIPQHRRFEIKTNLFNYASLIMKINLDLIDHVVIRSLAMRLEYYRPPSFYRQFFNPDPIRVGEIPEFGNDTLLFHIRGGDILTGVHPDHHPLPFHYYRHLIKESGLKPVFMGQFGDDNYSNMLRKEFRDCEFLKQRSVLQDFEILRRAKNVGIAVSSFSWMATWLSDRAEKIYCPVAGFMLANQRPDIDVLPINDKRYTYYQFPVWLFKASNLDYDKIYDDTLLFTKGRPKIKPRWQSIVRMFVRNKKVGLKNRMRKYFRIRII